MEQHTPSERVTRPGANSNVVYLHRRMRDEQLLRLWRELTEAQRVAVLAVAESFARSVDG